MGALASTPFSVLDLAPVATGSTVAEALRNSVDLARQVERLGYRRHWVAEHHNMPGIASSAPAVLIAHLASVTTTLRVGSGGVMLPNHQPLVVAEQFGMLEALHPGRIDLGIGRAPGTDQITAHALRRSFDPAADDLPVQLRELLAFFSGAVPRITAVPGAGNRPAIWLLGSSDFSARLAGELGKVTASGSDAHGVKELGRSWMEMDPFDGPADFLEKLARARHVVTAESGTGRRS